MVDENLKVDARNFLGTVAANVDNDKLTDEEFREFIRNSLPVVDYDKGIWGAKTEATE